MPAAAPGTALLPDKGNALLTSLALSPTGWEGSLGGEAIDLAKPPTRLFENESSGLLMFQSFFLIGLIRGRRKWLAALIAVVALSRSGLSAITEWIGLPKARATSAAPPPESTSRLMARVGSPSAPAERTYAGLLRRLAGDAASANLRTLITATNHEPAPRLASLARVAGFAVPAALPSPVAHIPAATAFAFLPSEGRSLLPPQAVCFALFARPPPPIARPWCLFPLLR